ncbi:group III truncated hemoglobin [Mariluticola halotolerans]|uniref:group III truncated hemoglobin n=1 Tax=Mariluticola halotolerans TaxID=2909283 RepID=UPI0026E31323|nr:group III truncated hemoglobin [Mariluticola halotolerans]UJQ94684.1 group III truncated hemoglobin [Mariluticola halotolerans]
MTNDREAETVSNLPPSEAQIAQLVREFYARVREDARLGPIFAQALGDDWEPHLLTMIDFWSSLMLRTGRYSGRPMQKHLALKTVRPDDFKIWLKLFNETAVSIGGPDFAKAFMERAERVAASFHAAMFYDPADDAPRPAPVIVSRM